MALTIYHNPQCSKSRQALKSIDDSGGPPDIIRYPDSPPSVADLRTLLEKPRVRTY
ncbi:MAG: hypothetical protein GDA39_00950 [Hyphomonadaceae bacterium]|nr:hypothetical protein [Hyphomonadaceae bacterium]MBC6411573.1 hypothetical protein [Hyphomonadaceae bacterium]